MFKGHEGSRRDHFHIHIKYPSVRPYKSMQNNFPPLPDVPSTYSMLGIGPSAEGIAMKETGMVPSTTFLSEPQSRGHLFL